MGRSHSLGSLVGVLLGATALVRAATAQDLSVGAAASAPRPTALGITCFSENDGASTSASGQTDRWYTSGTGLALQWQSEPTDKLVARIPSFGNEFAADQPHVSYAMGTILSLSIYTPANLAPVEPQFGDRPYASWGYSGIIVQRANRALRTPVFEHMELNVGILGPSSSGDDVQKWVHSNIAGSDPNGWDNQVRDEPAVDLKYMRRWLHDLQTPEGTSSAGMQLIPEAAFSLGTVRTWVGGGATLRYGWNLPDDFGPGSLRFADDFTRTLDASVGKRAVSGYFYLRQRVRLVGHDATLGNSFFRDNPVSVNEQPVVGEVTAGVVIVFRRHWSVAYSQTWVSPEFQGQGRWHSYGSLNVQAVFAW